MAWRGGKGGKGNRAAAAANGAAGWDEDDEDEDDEDPNWHTSGSRARPKLDWKIVDRPKRFSGQDFKEWRFRLINFLTLQTPSIVDLMIRSEEMSEYIELPTDRKDLEDARILFSIVASLVEGPARSCIRQGRHVLERNGYES